MRKKFVVAFSALMLSGCTGDQLEFRNPGSVNLSEKGFICIKSSPGDVLSFYLLSSSENHYAPPVLFADYINRKFPDTCIKAELKNDVTYVMDYIINNVKYKTTFKLNNPDNSKKGE